MIGLRSWAVILILYVVIICSLLSHESAPSSLSFFDYVNKRDTGLVYEHINHLGLSGRGLLRFFKKNLLQIVANEGLSGRKGHRDGGGDVHSSIHISQYYDSFKRYLYDSNRAGSTNLECAPFNSIVAKLTRDVTPLPIHSHNDYWRKLPLFEALAFGASSVEADVWIVPESHIGRDIKNQRINNNNNDGGGGGGRNHEAEDDSIQKHFGLAVGHNEAYLDPVHKTLDKLYTTPLKDMLDQVNCLDTSKQNGVFYNSPETTLFLYIDFKSKDKKMIYHLLMDKYFKPLIDSDYMTYYDTSKGQIVWKQITIILTGDFPRDLEIIDNGNGQHGYFYTDKRHVFLEADLMDPTSTASDTAIVSSSSFSQLLEKCNSSQLKVIWRGHLIRPEIACMKSYIEKAHSLNLKTRIWGVPNWPDHTAKTLWRQQIRDLHSDILNVDDLFLATTRF